MRGRSKTDWRGVCLEAPGSGGLRAAGPAAEGRQQMMMHLDIAVEDLAPAVADALELGATLPDFQSQDDVRVLLDPAGHPFCLYLDK
ncbi:MAG TPA: VOC family protein [Trebonia sp.]|nr:VOC family protein [Trebonia sp.]